MRLDVRIDHLSVLVGQHLVVYGLPVLVVLVDVGLVVVELLRY